jgi:Fe-Mn family superoxide dismutase
MNLNNHRRQFIKNALISSAGLALGIDAFATFISSCTSTKNLTIHQIKTGFDQTALSYKYEDLEDIIDKKTMEIHYSKHAAAYSKNLKEAAIAENINMQEPLENILGNISAYSTKIRNNGGGHYNHEMFWKCMQPKTRDNKPTGALLNAIEKNFKHFDEFKMQFTETAKNRFGSGWAWLIMDDKGRLLITSTANQDNPLMNISSVEQKGFPLLCLDVWEHAYYLKYQNKRADYIQGWWELVNWDYVAQRLVS